MKKYALGFSKKQLRMMEDNDFFDVDSKDVALLLRQMAVMGKSREEVLLMRTKYDLWIDDKEKRMMTELGLDYENHVIEYVPCINSLSLHRKEALINGYRVVEWKMLTDDSYVPQPPMLNAAKARLADLGDKDALDVLNMKYKFISDNKVALILKKNNIPQDAEFETLTRTHIDGISFYLWRLINDKEYIPKSKSNLVSTIRQLRKKGEVETADFLEDKYYRFLYPDRDIRDREKEIADAKEYFRGLFPDQGLHF